MFIEDAAQTWQKLLSVIEQFRPFQDTLDIVLVAFIIYKAIQLIRETRAEQLMKGIVLIAVAYLSVTILGMSSTKYILKYITNSALMIIVILFQPEIRRALEQLGRSSLSNLSVFGFGAEDESKKREAMNECIAQIALACKSMADKKIGALIVFEKDTMLSDIVKTGTVIDAQTTAEMVGNVFFPKAPLHDGAMIVRQSKVYAAGCILPLTKNMSISRELGTRHRAALGMSEESDAVIVIVSEETGVISIARSGILTRGLDETSLVEHLSTMVIKSPKETKDLPLKKRFLGGLKK